MNEIGSYLRNLRKMRGLTLVQLQEKSGVSNSYISQIENGQFQPSPDILKKLSVPLEISVFDLLKEAGYYSDEEYELATNLMNLNFRSVLKWSEDQLFTEKDTIIIREHFHDLLARYKQLVERYAYAKRAWSSSEGLYRQLYKDRLSDEEIKELYLKNELEHQIQSASEWIKAFPNWIARNEYREDENKEE